MLEVGISIEKYFVKVYAFYANLGCCCFPIIVRTSYIDMYVYISKKREKIKCPVGHVISFRLCFQLIMHIYYLLCKTIKFKICFNKYWVYKYIF